MLGFVIAKLVTHAYWARYMIAASPGIFTLLILGLRRIIANDRLGPALICAMCLPFFIWQIHTLNRQEFDDLQGVRSDVAALRRTGDAPIAITNAGRLHLLSFYARRDLVRRLAYVADVHLSTRYLGHDTVDRAHLALNPWFPLNVVWWHDWLSAHPSFMAYGPLFGEFSWLPLGLPAIGDVQLLKREDQTTGLLSVQNVKVPANDRTASDPSGEPMLYRQLAGLAAPLCTIYMTDRCPDVDDASAGTADSTREAR